MPKKNGITKTYSFDEETIKQMGKICSYEKRTQTSLIEFLISRHYSTLFEKEKVK